jgi:hypothetical protein
MKKLSGQTTIQACGLYWSLNNNVRTPKGVAGLCFRPAISARTRHHLVGSETDQ